MKIQYLSIVFVIIALPIILITSTYNRLQINTVKLQKDYDAKLVTATYDAIQAFEINAENNEYVTVSDSKRRDIEASIETFMTSLSTGLGVSGYGSSYLKPYIPAMLFTLYDGYYIYSPTENNGTIKHTLKPFITYSQRYVHGNIDVVICYTLDNYVTIYGRVGTEYVRKSGYLNYYLLNETLVEQTESLTENLFVIKENFAPYTKTFSYAENENGYMVFYDSEKGLWFEYSGNQMIRYITATYTPIGQSTITISGIDYGFDTNRVDEKDYVNAFIKEYNYFYEGNQKIYYDSDNQKCFTYLNATKRMQQAENVQYTGDSSYYNYARESKEFTQWVVDNLGDLTISDAVDSEGNKNILMFKGDTAKFLEFNEYNKPEESNTLFNTHKREVIKLSIETNLAAAINNYDKNSVALDTTYHFKMPVIQENEWDRILSNISLVTFLQGLPAGLKTYNGYAIVTSSTNKEYVTDDTIYFLDSSKSTYHRIGCEELDVSQTIVGYRNSDFERTKVTVSSVNGRPEETLYYYKHDCLPCYYCIVNRLATRERNIFNQNSVDYNWTEAATRRSLYYKALGRERYNVVH